MKWKPVVSVRVALCVRYCAVCLTIGSHARGFDGERMACAVARYDDDGWARGVGKDNVREARVRKSDDGLKGQ